MTRTAIDSFNYVRDSFPAPATEVLRMGPDYRHFAGSHIDHEWG